MLKLILEKERPKNLEDFFLRRLGLPYLGSNHFIQDNKALFLEARQLFEQKLEVFDTKLWEQLLSSSTNA